MAAPVAVDGGVKRGTLGQQICRVKVLAGPEYARTAVYTNLHLPLQDKAPLRVPRAMELAAKAHRAGAQLVTARRKHFREHGLRIALVQRNRFLTELGKTIGVGIQNDLGEGAHGGPLKVGRIIHHAQTGQRPSCTICRMQFLHTMLRVGNLQRSIDFYTHVLGMQVLRTSENPEYKYSLAFLGFEGGNPAQAEIELTYNWGVESYELGTAYGHIALGVPDAYAAVEKIKAAGGNVTREAGPVKGGSTVIAFVTDPDGYKIELIQKTPQEAGVGLR